MIQVEVKTTQFGGASQTWACQDNDEVKALVNDPGVWWYQRVDEMEFGGSSAGVIGSRPSWTSPGGSGWKKGGAWNVHTYDGLDPDDDCDDEGRI